MNPRRITALLYVVLLTGFALGAGALFLDAQAEYNTLKQAQAASRANLAAARARLHEQERALARLKSDSQFVEKMIRVRLGYARADEWIFRFED